MTVSLEDQIKELERELAMREQFYPQWIASGKLKRPIAVKQFTALKAALQSLKDLQK